MYCRFCNRELEHKFISLGAMPLANSYLSSEQLLEMEPYYPLEVYVCAKCFLVQVGEYQSPENIFSDYAYFSSYSDTWLEHCRDYADKMIEWLDLAADSQVIEVASNDGYLLQYFITRGISVLGIEPAANVAQIAIGKGIPTEQLFFGKKTAENLRAQGKYADLLIGNNVLAHVPDLNDFVAGLKSLLKPAGIITMEFPHLMRLVEGMQFDTIYHEHFSYFSFISVEKIFTAHGLKIFDVEEIPTHGGSLRIYAGHWENRKLVLSMRVIQLRKRELKAGYNNIDNYIAFENKVRMLKRQILLFLILVRESGKKVAAYGAPAKGNTLLNYCGISTDFIDFTVDRSPYKQGLYLPGSHIPVKSPDEIQTTRPDYVIILPWNLREEIIEQLTYIREWNGQLVTLIPKVRVF